VGACHDCCRLEGSSDLLGDLPRRMLTRQQKVEEGEAYHVECEAEVC
jgi:hypothetical protein